jgi:NTE family protein
MAGKLALVLSGGGAKGAFQVGVLDELITSKGVAFDIVVGVSTGSLQAVGVAQGDVPGLVREWQAIRKNSDIYKKRLLGAAGGFFGADAIYDASPLRRILDRFTDEAKLRASGIKLLLGVANLGTGEFRTIDETAQRIAAWAYASCAMPVFFDPLVGDNAGVREQYVDGGVRNVTPLSAALDQKPRAVLVVRASPRPQPGPDRIFPDLIRIGLRAVDILQSEVSLNDIDGASMINDLIAARAAQAQALAAAGVTGATAAGILKPLDDQIAHYHFAPIALIEPEVEYSSTLEFDPVKIAAAIEGGRKAARDAFPALQALLQ